MRAAQGAELSRTVSFPVSESDIRRWAIAVYFPEPPPPMFWDATAAERTIHKGIVAPEEFNPFAWMSADGPAVPDDGGYDPDSTEKGLGLRPPGLRNMLNGGVEVEYGVRMRPGDVITSVRRLGAYSERTGRLGTMLMTVFEDTWTNQRDERVKLSTMTLIRY
ncbi:MaoC family dehydratase [Amycolatopsis sp. K13G38]|uniref:MaoC family dehydratase n=2 Tax=Amycolatopsis acididurans TaxID=2724524 RepID=A0ABX1IVT2_9PSEU|nr:MaoC family dehydratase [Amycolatopsis acididurans]